MLLSASITSHRWSPQGWAQDVLGAPQLDEHLAAAPRLQGAAVAGEAGHAAGEATCHVSLVRRYTCHLLHVCHVLQDIVSVDRDTMTVSVEPNITIGLLNRALVCISGI